MNKDMCVLYVNYMITRVSCVQKHMDVSIIIERADPANGKIILNPPYQRNVVWDLNNMSEFIDSVMMGVNCHHIILNQDDERLISICIDGRQRLNSLIKYSKNEFPWPYNGVNYYYDKIPKNSDGNCKVLSNTDRAW